MEEGDTFPLGSLARRLVDQPKAGDTASLERRVEVVHGEADVVDSWPAFGDELADGRVRVVSFEQLDERVTGSEPGDPGAIGIGELDFGEAEQVAIEGKDLVERANGDPNVGDASGTARDVSHVSALVRWGAGAEY